MSEDETAHVTREMLTGLSYLHSQGITHRDIKVCACVLVCALGESNLRYRDVDAKRTPKTTVVPHFYTPSGVYLNQLEVRLCMYSTVATGVGVSLPGMLPSLYPWLIFFWFVRVACASVVRGGACAVKSPLSNSPLPWR